MFLAGDRMPIRHAVLIGLLETTEWKLVFDHVSDWQDEACQVTVYRGDVKNQAWLELYLNILLEWHCQNMFKYYQQLTGAVMVKSVLQSMSVLAENKGWHITTHNQELKYASIFSSAAEAGDTYRDVLSAIRSRIEPIIGNSLTGYLTKQSTEPLTGIYKMIENVFHLVEAVE